jgi:hypothetical protein
MAWVQTLRAAPLAPTAGGSAGGIPGGCPIRVIPVDDATDDVVGFARFVEQSSDLLIGSGRYVAAILPG